MSEEAADGSERPEAEAVLSDPPKPSFLYQIRGLGIGVPILVIIDQVTKTFADRDLPGRAPIVIIEGIFQLRYSRNPGAFFSLGADLPDGFRRVFFVVATLLAIALIVRLHIKAGRERWALRAALFLLLSGAVGNLVDRVFYGEVIDFLHLHYEDVFHWATFNVADMYICVGLILLVVDMIRPGPKTEPAPPD
ncbi:MAG: signal peptidase II [Myxococcota bacterium]